uniref:Metalloendopeptidase n=1 Tax=Mola mola TaxID=94237 RepID=A0A3Q4B7R5_MOLML
MCLYLFMTELLTDTHAVVQGDIVLYKSHHRSPLSRLSQEPVLDRCLRVFPARRTDDVLSAMAMISEHTCVSFHRRTSEANYLCASYVGFISGEQSLFVGPLCIVGNIVHEILHALGFHHEHTRKDRTQHIKILSHNIMKGKEKNFAMQDGETFGLSYDTKSIMHYGSGYFSVNGLPTIVPLVEVDNMGQRVKMTEADIQRVRRLYNCGMSTVYFTGIYWP